MEIGYTRAVRRLSLALLVLVLAVPEPAWAAETAPAFTLRLLEGTKAFDSRAYLGKKLLLVRFQASWCKVCAREGPAFERNYRKYRRRGVEFVAVQLQDDAQDARKFLKAHRASYPAGLDPDLRIADRFGVTQPPHMVVISKKGEIVSRRAGPMSEAELAKLLDRLLAPPVKKSSGQ
ncbi:MAG: TlpA disulfide reductase family protein [candidate division NC10 bacterium]